MKILHIANFGFNKQGAHFYCTDRKISAGLTENGHFVYDFSFRDMARMGTIFKTKKLGANWANKEVLKVVDNLEPDLVLVGHSDLMSPNVLKEIKQRYPQTKIAFWYVDWLCEEPKSSFIYDFLPYADAIFCTTGGELLKQYKTDNKKVAYIPNMVNSAVESLRQFEKDNYANELVFLGTIEKNSLREKFIFDTAQNLGIKMKCFGTFENNSVYGSEYIKVLSQSRMGLNYSRRNDIELYSSDRIAQLTGNGLLTFCPNIPNFNLLYTDDELVYFENAQDLLEKFKVYSEDINLSRSVAKKGWEKTHRAYNCKRVTKFMLETIYGDTCSEKYEWASYVY
ncbi:glycosyltransferase [Acinetobacter sp.]|uniref:glycosyltransferase family protein n=1 Tax=Acinetobacter sp. TaxID=472 RepID=UPI0035AED7F6